jgi:hypothetical protein
LKSALFRKIITYGKKGTISHDKEGDGKGRIKNVFCSSGFCFKNTYASGFIHLSRKAFTAGEYRTASCIRKDLYKPFPDPAVKS